MQHYNVDAQGMMLSHASGMPGARSVVSAGGAVGPACYAGTYRYGQRCCVCWVMRGLGRASQSVGWSLLGGCLCFADQWPVRCGPGRSAIAWCAAVQLVECN